jgi:hypothetical protein
MSDEQPKVPILTEILPETNTANAFPEASLSRLNGDSDELRQLLAPVVEAAAGAASERTMAEMKRVLEEELEVELQRRLAELIERLAPDQPPDTET